MSLRGADEAKWMDKSKKESGRDGVFDIPVCGVYWSVNVVAEHKNQCKVR